MFAKRTGWTFRLNRLTRQLREMQEAGRVILDLTESNPTRCRFQYPADILNALDEPETLNYRPSPKGMLQSRKVVAQYYLEKGVFVDPERIFLTASTSEAYSFLFRLLLNPKEHLLIPRPSYPLFEFLAALNDVVLDPYPLVYDKEGTFSDGEPIRNRCVPGGWRIDVDALKASLNLKSRAIILVHPNNPTGSFVKDDERKLLTRFAKRHRLSQICDEVFLDYVYQKDASHIATFAGSEGCLTFTLSGISKLLALPQMKLAWLVVNGPKKLCEAAIKRLEIISDTYLSVSTPSQQALKRWFECRPLLQAEIQKRLLTNRGILLERCHSSHACEVLHVEGGWYAILRLPKIRSEEEWALEFLEKEAILVHPGYFFDFVEGTQVVLSLLVTSDDFNEGVKRLFSCVDRLLEGR